MPLLGRHLPPPAPREAYGLRQPGVNAEARPPPAEDAKADSLSTILGIRTALMRTREQGVSLTRGGYMPNQSLPGRTVLCRYPGPALLNLFVFRAASMGTADQIAIVSRPRHGSEPPAPVSRTHHDRLANAIRALAMDAVEKAKSGHPGLPMGAADVATVLFTQFLKFDADHPDWPDRDRFVLSAGHGSMLLYALLYLTGNPDMTLDQIKHFRQLESKTPGHPENFHTKGVETTTGPLGQGIATSVGMALAEKMLAAEFGKKIVDHHTYVLASDGDLMEGISQEAIAMAGHWKLNKMIVLYDDNGISIDGPTSIADSVDQVKRFKSAGWAAELIDGQDQAAIAAAITRAKESNKPSLIACKTTIGYGAPHKAGTAKAHGEALGADELKAAKEKLGISLEPFSVPDDVLKSWREAGSRGAAARQEWETRFN